MNKKHITIGAVIITVLLIVIALVSIDARNNTPEVTTTEDNTSDAGITAIKSFMAQPDLELEYTRTKSPTNFTVGKTEPFPDGGGGRTTVPDEWKRSVGVYRQQNIDNKCQLYMYEVDVRNNQIVEVQPAPNVPIGTELANEQGACQTQLKAVTDAEAKQTAEDYLKRNINNYEKIKDQFKYTKGDRYIWLYEDRSYKAPEGLTSEPYPYPTIRIIVSREGYLIGYINTTGLYK